MEGGGKKFKVVLNYTVSFKPAGLHEVTFAKNSFSTKGAVLAFLSPRQLVEERV